MAEEIKKEETTENTEAEAPKEKEFSKRVTQLIALSALVLAHMSARTPFLPSSANLCRSSASPKTGV